MGLKVGFGILSICTGGISREEGITLLSDFAGKGWSTHFVDVFRDYKTVDSPVDTFYEVTCDGGKNTVSELKEISPGLLQDWDAGPWPLDLDDADLVFEFDVFLPNSNLGDGYDYYDLPGNRDERKVASIEYAIGRIEAQKAEYEEDNDEGETEEDIQRMNEYLEIFRCAARNNFVVSFSWG